MTCLARYHDAVKRRQGRARQLKKLLDSVGVTVPSAEHRWQRDMTRCTTAVEAIQSLVDKYGADNVRLALRLLVETNDENAKQLRGAVITALTVIVARHDYGQLGLALFDAMDRIDVGEQVTFARKLKHRPGDDLAGILLGLLAGEIRRNLGELA